MFLHFLFFTCCAHPFSFRASIFTKRTYVSLYSDFHSVQTCWIWKTYLNTYVFFSFFHPCLLSRDEISSRQKRVNSKRHFTIDMDDFIPGRVSSRDEISRVNALSDCWSRDMLNFDFLVSPPYFGHDFSRKIFLILYIINAPSFIIWLPFLF